MPLQFKSHYYSFEYTVFFLFLLSSWRRYTHLNLLVAGNMVANNWSRFVLVIWLFMMFVIMQSFTANLSSMLTIDRLAELSNTYEYIGYQEGSFVKNLLVNRLNYSESKLKVYSTIEEYHEALSNGSSKGGIDAIMDEIPYMKLFLHRYPSLYTMYGPTYKTDGFGFVSLSISFSWSVW